MSQFDIACQALFMGRINVPGAAKMCDLAVDEMKRKFVDYVKIKTREDWELDITPCWPYA